MSHVERASTHETSTDSFRAPMTEEHPTDDPVAQVARLSDYLWSHFPDEMARTNTQLPEAPADVAIRLISSLHASTPPTVVRRCDQPYCNQPYGHTDQCPQFTQGR